MAETMIAGAVIFLLGFICGCIFLVLAANARRNGDRDG